MSTVINNSFSNFVPVVVNTPTTGSANAQSDAFLNSAFRRPSNSYRTSEAQIEVWLSSLQSQQASCAYNETCSLTFAGDLNKDILKRAFAKVVERHSSMRTTFSEDGQFANVFDDLPFGYREIDFSHQTENLQPLLSAVIDEEARTPFDLLNGPLVRLVLQTLSPTQHKLTMTVHHIVLDGWSLALVCKDLGYFYDVLSGIERQPLPAACNYETYSEAMRKHFDSDAGRADEEFWVRQFEDQIPVLDLPIEKSRPNLRTYNASRYEHLLSSDLIERVRTVGSKHGCSLFNVMLAAFNAYVARISGNSDFCIGIPTAGQAAMDQPELVGHCVNTIPLRNKIDINESFVDTMKSSRTTLLNAFEHQRYSYGTLLRKLAPPRDPSRPPMLNVSFNIDPTIDVTKIGFRNLNVDITIEPRAFENFEWFINGVILSDKSIQMQVQYNSDLYTRRSMQFYFEGFETFLSEIAANPHQRIADIHCMSVSQRRQVIVDWNATEMDYPTNSTLHQEFSRQALATPDKVAVTFENTSLTYAEVESQSNQIARYLANQGIVAGDLVGICVKRSAQMLVNLYGILKSGAGYVPLDPAYPSERLQYMCEHSGLKLIVTEAALVERVSEFNKPMIAIDRVDSEIQNLDVTTIDQAVTPNDICYVIYTSGSTGKPKGVQVPHGAVVNFLYSMQQTPGFGADDSVLAVTTLSFDIAVLELYFPTVSGGRVVIVDSLTAADGVKLAQQLESRNITLMQATPATWRLMIQAGWAGKRDLKILCGGEPMPADLVGPLLDRCGELWNMYGPTETTVWSAAFQITNATDPILIGKPIGNTQIFILDARGNEVPAGCEGEVFIGGAGVTLGYRNRQDLTDERFLANRYRNPFKDYVSDTIYKTGDLARYTFDGNIQFLRRNDKQVKVRGFRIELGEIEQTLKRHPAVEQNVVIVREDKPGDARLVAYLITRPGVSVTSSQLRDHVRELLPFYMVPQHFVELDRMPQTNNGKIDYKALPAPMEDAGYETATEIETPKTDAKKFLASVWSEVLQIDDIGVNETFFDVGGHSLLVMKVITKVFEATQVKLGPQDFLIATLAQMAHKLEGSKKFSDSNAHNSSKTLDATELASNRALVSSKDARLCSSDSQSPVQASTTESNDREDSAEKTTALNRTTEKANGLFRVLKGFWN